MARRKEPTEEDEEERKPPVTYALDPGGAKQLRAAMNRAGRPRITYENIAKDAGLKASTIHDLFHERQRTCIQLPKICRFLGVPFAETLPMLDREDRRALAALAEIRSKDEGAATAAVRSLEAQARGMNVDPQRPEPRPTGAR